MYSQIDGEYRYQLHNIDIRSKEIAILYSYEPSQCVMHKHGKFQYVQEHFDKYLNAFRQTTFPELADQLRIIRSSSWDVDTLNSIINCSGYIGRFLEDSGIMETGNEEYEIIKPNLVIYQ